MGDDVGEQATFRHRLLIEINDKWADLAKITAPVAWRQTGAITYAQDSIE